MTQWFNVTRSADSLLRSVPDTDMCAGLGISRVVKLPTGISVDMMRTSLSRVVQENESLRVCIQQNQGIWQQTVSEHVSDATQYFPLAVTTTDSAESSEFEDDVASWINDCHQQKFIIGAGKLLASSSFVDSRGETWCYLSIHPAIADTFTVETCWGRIAALLRHEILGTQEVHVHNIVLSQLLDAQRKTAGQRFAHTEFWLANPRCDLRDDESEERILSQPDTSLKQQRDNNPWIPFSISMSLSPEIKSLLLQASNTYGGTWEQAQLASIGSFLARKINSSRVNIGYTFSNLLLFEESAPWSDAASQILCRSEVTLPISIPKNGRGLEQMKQAKVQIDRIEDYSLVNELELEAIASNTKSRVFGSKISVRNTAGEIIMGESNVQLHTLSNGPIEDFEIIVSGLEDETEPSNYQILANSHLYTQQEMKLILEELMAWQYQWALSVLNKTDTESI